MGFKKRFLDSFRRRSKRHDIEFKRDSLHDKFEDFINVISKLEDKSIVLKRKYTSHYFHDDSYETPLYYGCLQVPEQYRNLTKVDDLKALSYFKATLVDFIKAFDMILVNDIDHIIANHITTMKNMKAQLKALMKLIPHCVTGVRENFRKREVEEITKKYIAGLQEAKTLKSLFPGMTTEECENRITGLAIIKQFYSFLNLFTKVLQDLLQLLPA